MLAEYKNEEQKKEKAEIMAKVRNQNLEVLAKTKKDIKEEIYNEIRKEVDSHNEISQTTKLLKKEKKLREADETFQLKRQETENRAEQIELQFKVFEDRQKAMRQEVEEKSTLINMSAKKREQEEEKGKKEDDQIKNKEEEIKKKTAEAHEEEIKLSNLQAEIKHLNGYSTYLQSVVDASEEFDDIAALMNRHGTLKEQNDKLKSDIARYETDTQECKSDHVSSMKQKKDEISVHTGVMHTLEQGIEKLQNDIGEEETKTEQIQKKKVKRKGKHGAMIMAIKNLYVKAVQSRSGRKNVNVPVEPGLDITTDDILFYLSTIHRRIIELNDLTQDITDEQVNQKKNLKELLRKEEEARREQNQLIKKPTLKTTTSITVNKKKSNMNSNRTNTISQSKEMSASLKY